MLGAGLGSADEPTAVELAEGTHWNCWKFRWEVVGEEGEEGARLGLRGMEGEGVGWIAGYSSYLPPPGLDGLRRECRGGVAGTTSSLSRERGVRGCLCSRCASAEWSEAEVGPRRLPSDGRATSSLSKERGVRGCLCSRPASVDRSEAEVGPRRLPPDGRAAEPPRAAGVSEGRASGAPLRWA